jgi:hypothetical protein
MRRAWLALGLVLGLGAGTWAHAARAAAFDLLDLKGTWYVLVHYKDSASNNPDLERWQDRIWVFEPSGSRLKWIEYPIVVFDDESGRFERTNAQYGRVMQFWEPNPGQLDQISSGLSINPRGSKTKTLRGSAAEGWRSRGPIAAMSANTLTYTEIWSVEGLGGLPVFRMEESLGGARAETLEGVTLYQTAEITPSGELRGTFNRDGSRIGTFRAMRAGAVGEVKKSASQAEVRARAMSATAGPAVAEGLAEVLGQPGVSEQDVRRILKGKVLGAGGDPKLVDDEIRSLSEAIWAEHSKGTPPAEVERKVRTGVIRP